MTAQQINLSEQLQAVIARSERRTQLINYVLAALLAVVLGWALYASWRNAQQPKIESVKLVESSVRVLSPTASTPTLGGPALCPGETLVIRFAVDVEGTGTVLIDDFVQHAEHTVKFSRALRDWFSDSGRRVYEDEWVIPPRPAMAIDGSHKWMPGTYTRIISIAASNAYISRYVTPATLPLPFTIRENCE